MPVRVRILKPVVTVSVPVSKETSLTADMLRVDFVDEQQLRGDVFADMTPLIGTQPPRVASGSAGAANSDLCGLPGDTVQIEAATPAIAIRTEGRALQDGSFGDTVRVENVRSHRIISATVVAIGQVRVKL